MYKASEIWNYIDQKRPNTVNKSKWKQSYEGVCEALLVLNIQMITSREEFNKLKVPCSYNRKYYMRRKIQVLYPDGRIKKPSTIERILNYSYKKKNSDPFEIEKLFIDDDLRFFSNIIGCVNDY